MADVAKYAAINGGSAISYLKTNLSVIKPKKTVSLAYSLIFISIAFTIFLAFTPNLFTPTTRSNHAQESTSIFNSASLVKSVAAIGDFDKKLLNCDLYDGNWVRDESYPLYEAGSCSLIDEQFNCFLNGRPDSDYMKLKWKPKACSLPRLNGRQMLELLRGKRLVFVGDSLNRNMWESLVCILKKSVEEESKVYEVSGSNSYAFAFKEYKCTVEFLVSPFLVQEWEWEVKGSMKETLRLDVMSNVSHEYKDADIILFNTGHWWTHEKTSKGEDYYQEGTHVYTQLNVVEAFRRAITTWGRWIDANLNPATNSLLLFRAYSASHFRYINSPIYSHPSFHLTSVLSNSGGQWNSGGQCHNETDPIKNDAYLSRYPDKMRVVEEVLRGMKTHVTYMNVTRMTDYRKDAHPSIYRNHNLSEGQVQDCSHWCLPGVPDAWNQILYAELLLKLHHSHNRA